MTEVVISSAVRTPIGKFNGGLSGFAAHELGVVAVQEALARAGVEATDVDELIMGQVYSAGAGLNPARQTAIHAGMRVESTAFTVNQACGSGMRAVAEGMQNILTGAADVVVAGGQEVMSGAPHLIHLRQPHKMGDATLLDSMLKDGLIDPFHDYHMGVTAENVVERHQITRERQDGFAVDSQTKAAAAAAAGRFKDEIAPVTVKTRKGETVIDADESIRPETTMDSLGGLRAVFKKDGTVTAGNASTINDGAAALTLMTADEAKRRGAPVRAAIKGWATAGVDPAVMGLGPVPAIEKLLKRIGWSLADADLIEVNEAFAGQVCGVIQGLGLDEAKLNVNGGAIALGHPVGASGARVLVTLLHEMERRDVPRGIASLCIGGGMGIAMAIERS